MRVRFTPSGRAQFLAAVTYIRADNVEAAQRFRRHAEQIYRPLADTAWIVAVWHGAQRPERPR